jgi:aspartate/methionine/tyrosine aminotransferase
MPLQAVAERLWADEDHVEDNRALYQAKYNIADEIFADVPGYQGPEAGFFLWLPVENGEEATLKLWRETGVRVLPGAYLAREVDGVTPGHDRIRVAMVAEQQEMRRGLQTLREALYD